MVSDLRMLAEVESLRPRVLDYLPESHELLIWLSRSLYLVVGATFIAWLFRTYRNLHLTGNHTLRFAQHWAITGWFIPIVHLVRPFQIVTDISNSLAENISDDSGQTRNRIPRSVIAVWWLLVLALPAAIIWLDVYWHKLLPGYFKNSIRMEGVIIALAVLTGYIVHRIESLQRLTSSAGRE